MTTVKKTPVSLYTRRWCGYCFAARRLLKGLGIDYKEIPLDRQPERRAEISKLAGGWRTVPMIFVGDRFIGGYTEIAVLHRRGELMSLVKSASPDLGPTATDGPV